MRSWMSLPLILVVVVIIRSLPVPGSQFHNEAPAITFQPYHYLDTQVLCVVLPYCVYGVQARDDFEGVNSDHSGTGSCVDGVFLEPLPQTVQN